MNQTRPTTRPEASDDSTDLIADMYRGLNPLVQDMRRLDGALQNLQAIGDASTLDAVQSLRRRVRQIEPSVTLIGQVKAGKTSLVNAMSGGSCVLPSDVNPWTSVVTSLHLSPALKPANQHAHFRFFAEAEWTNLLATGGRVGELASRAGADRELEKVRRQLYEMREKSRRRLGASFEQLLGQSHEYRYVDEELIQRYVCLGDDFVHDTNSDTTQGRFADITKSADLFVSMPSLPLPVCLRDTPGVNDTFMVREQITVNAIRGSRLCVVVLSAHQALSTVDLALVRLIANIPSRDVIIFVNRVDELADPVREIPEIRESILRTLLAQGVPGDTEIVFGSALWAHHALNRNLNAMDTASADALIKFAEVEVRRATPGKDPFSTVWALSGLPALGQAIANRVVSGEGAQCVEAVASAARNVANAISASRAIAERRIVEGPVKPLDLKELTSVLDKAGATALEGLSIELADLIVALETRLEKSRQAFVSRAVSSLIEHLETHGEKLVWTYDPTGLRLLLRSGYHVFATKASRVGEDHFIRCSSNLKQMFLDRCRLPDIGFDLEPPAIPVPPPPVMLGQTIALDIKGGWWSRWWRKRRSYQSFAEEFRALIDAEIAPMVDGLKADLAKPFTDALTSELAGFVAAQRETLLDLANQSPGDLERMRHQLASSFEQQDRALTNARIILTDFRTQDTRKARP